MNRYDYLSDDNCDDDDKIEVELGLVCSICGRETDGADTCTECWSIIMEEFVDYNTDPQDEEGE